MSSLLQNLVLELFSPNILKFHSKLFQNIPFGIDYIRELDANLLINLALKLFDFAPLSVTGTFYFNAILLEIFVFSKYTGIGRKKDFVLLEAAEVVQAFTI